VRNGSQFPELVISAYTIADPVQRSAHVLAAFDSVQDEVAEVIAALNPIRQAFTEVIAALQPVGYEIAKVISTTLHALGYQITEIATAL